MKAAMYSHSAGAMHKPGVMQEAGGILEAGDAANGLAGLGRCSGEMEFKQGSGLSSLAVPQQELPASAADVAPHGHRCRDTADSIDWEAVRAAETHEVPASFLGLFTSSSPIQVHCFVWTQAAMRCR